MDSGFRRNDEFGRPPPEREEAKREKKKGLDPCPRRDDEIKFAATMK
jgi:hypothetical protein